MNSLSRKIHQLILSGGPITFAQFMDMSLYSPRIGYYEQPGKIGRGGDFFTSASVGPLFGQLLAFQFADWLETDFPEGKIHLIEAGAHDGRLAADILEWLQSHRPNLMARLEYCIIDSSPARRQWQAETLRSWESVVNWTPAIGDLGASQINGILFSNEFFDALPVHRLAWNVKESCWREWRVAAAGDAFAWLLGEPDPELAPRLPLVPPELAVVLPDGFIAEISPIATDWWSAAAKALRCGKLLAIDYGFSSETGLRSDHPQGTLRACHRHHASTDLLANPGDQDLTADVNFSALEKAGRDAGLGPALLFRQEKFLTQIVSRITTNPASFAPWTAKTARQFQTLAHPAHLGHPFQVLIQPSA